MTTRGYGQLHMCRFQLNCVLPHVSGCIFIVESQSDMWEGQVITENRITGVYSFHRVTDNKINRTGRLMWYLWKLSLFSVKLHLIILLMEDALWRLMFSFQRLVHFLTWAFCKPLKLEPVIWDHWPRFDWQPTINKHRKWMICSLPGDTSVNYSVK